MLLLVKKVFFLCRYKCNHYKFGMNKLAERLIRHGIKPSLQRIAILRYLDSHRTHPTADMIFSDLSPEMPTLSKMTVYNTLKLLVEKGIVQMITIDEKNVRYDADRSSHGHFKCKGCGCVYDVSFPIPDTCVVEGVGESTIDEVHLYFRGYCKKCLVEKEKKYN